MGKRFVSCFCFLSSFPPLSHIPETNNSIENQQLTQQNHKKSTNFQTKNKNKLKRPVHLKVNQTVRPP